MISEQPSKGVWLRRLGTVLIGLSALSTVAAFVMLGLAKVAGVAAAFVLAEIFFWLGATILGREAIAKLWTYLRTTVFGKRPE
jgi:hypothetical protein